MGSLCGRDVPSVKRIKLVQHRVEAMSGLDQSASPLSHRASLVGVGKGFPNRGGQRGIVAAGEDASGFAGADDFRDAAHVAADDRSFASECLQADLRDAFMFRGRDDEYAQCPQHRWHIVAITGQTDHIVQRAFGDYSFDVLLLWAIADDDVTRREAGGFQPHDGIEKSDVAFPRTQHRHHADEGGGISVRRNRRFCSRRRKEIQIYSRRRGGDAVIGQREHFLKMFRDAIARGQDVVCQRGVRVAANALVRVIHVNVSCADDERHARQPTGHAHHPAVTRAVRIDDVRTDAPQPRSETQRLERMFPAREIRRFAGDAVGLCVLENLAVRRREQPHVVAAPPETLQFGHDAAFLSAPAGGGFGVDDAPAQFQFRHRLNIEAKLSEPLRPTPIISSNETFE